MNKELQSKEELRKSRKNSNNMDFKTLNVLQFSTQMPLRCSKETRKIRLKYCLMLVTKRKMHFRDFTLRLAHQNPLIVQAHRLWSQIGKSMN